MINRTLSKLADVRQQEDVSASSGGHSVCKPLCKEASNEKIPRAIEFPKSPNIHQQQMMRPTLLGAIAELYAGFANWRFWTYLGWQDIRRRYRRSILGPFWVTLSMSIFITALGTVYGRLFKINTADYLPYLTAGYLTWFFISGMLNEGCNTFIEASNFLKEVRLPLSLFVARIIWRNFLIFLHNSVVFVLVAIIFSVPVSLNLLAIIPGLLLNMLAASWIILLIGMLSTRFQDITQIVQSLITVVFFISPIVWTAKTIGSDSSIIKYNLLNYFLSIIRDPLLGQLPSASTWVIATSIAVLGWLITIPLFVRKRQYLVFWL